MDDLAHQLSIVNKFSDDLFYSFIANYHDSRCLASQVESCLISYGGGTKAEQGMLISLGEKLAYGIWNRHARLIELCRLKGVNYRSCDEVIAFLKHRKSADSECIKLLALIITRFGYRL